MGALVDPYGRVNKATLRTIFDEFDSDGSGSIDAGEVAALMVGLRLSSSEGLAPDKATIDTWFAVRFGLLGVRFWVGIGFGCFVELRLVYCSC
jgi:hypothetical protein